jgi:sporulation protein YlmC with PRC-barrel domain
MQIKNGAAVYTADGKDVGRIDRVVLDPRTGEITHLVVRKGWLFTEDKVVPVSLVDRISEDEVMLLDNAQDYHDLPNFEETHYVQSGDGANDAPAGREGVGPVDFASYAPGLYWYPPSGALWPGHYTGAYGYPMSNFATHTEQNIPAGTVGLRENADVFTADGELVGQVDQILTNDQLNRATHLVIRAGALFREKRLIPVDWIREVQEDSIQLGVRRGALDRVLIYQP